MSETTEDPVFETARWLFNEVSSAMRHGDYHAVCVSAEIALALNLFKHGRGELEDDEFVTHVRGLVLVPCHDVPPSWVVFLTEDEFDEHVDQGLIWNYRQDQR